MATKTFEQWVAQIQTAIYGEEVREAIVEALRLAYAHSGQSELTPEEIATVKEMVEEADTLSELVDRATPILSLADKVDEIEPNNMTKLTPTSSEISTYGNSLVKLAVPLNTYSRVVLYYADNLNHQYGSTELTVPTTTNAALSSMGYTSAQITDIRNHAKSISGNNIVTFGGYRFDLSAIEAASMNSTYIRRQRFVISADTKMMFTYRTPVEGEVLGGPGVLGISHLTKTIATATTDPADRNNDIISIYKVVGFKE